MLCSTAGFPPGSACGRHWCARRLGAGVFPIVGSGAASTRVSSLTHVVPTGNYPNGALSSFYPYFLRTRSTPAMHDVVAEEVAMELLSPSHDPTYDGREFTGLSTENAIRSKIRTTQA